MTKLSPAALAVWSAFLNHSEWEVTTAELCGVAAALRAAVAQTQRHPGHDLWQCDAEDLLAIAAELEAQ